ncbi:amino acid adenylation domain-containing protein [Ancylobacter lacus]|nr:non-ribosomal peptide synthetase [Ancylobacter lacus]MBS7539011.1 amino acid adenylation domain-containing protein [Ancylobacter lacus]
MAPADDDATLLPLAEAQEGLWFAQRRAPHDPLFNTGQYVELRGPLDRAAFAAAVNQALAEAEALALRFVDTSEGPRQAVDPARRPALVEVDLAAATDPFAAATARIATEMARPVDPLREALAATTLYRLGEGRHVWHLRIHHLAIDGYGILLLTRRVAELYNAAVAGEPAGAPLTPFAVALAEDAAYRAGPKREADAAFWRAAFADRPDAASLATAAASLATAAPAAPPPGAPPFHRASVELGAAARAALDTRAAETGLPWPDVATALAAAFCRRHTGTAEIILGVPHMGRLGSPAARAACMLMNVLPLRVRPDESAPLADFLAATGRDLLRARRHGRYRSEQLRRDLRLVGGHQRLHGPLVNILPFDETPRFAGLEARLEVLSTGPVDDIGFTFRRHGADGAIRLEVDAAPAFYAAGEAAALARRLEAFLAASGTAARLADIPTATPEETRRLVHDLNATAHPVPDTTLAALIEAGMRADPAATALVFGAASMDYATLDRRSAALAGQLAAAGLGPGDLVAVALPRSLELMVALVAVLRAGAAYLPLDLAQPAARLARILASARPRLALAEGTARARLEPQVPVLPPELWAEVAPSTAATTPPQPGDAAYVLYTSGSTGEPKGVVIEHRAIVNRLLWMQAQYGFGPADVILQKTPATFDVSVWEFFLPLICGARLVIAAPEAHRDPVALAALVRRHGVGTLHFVPSMLAAFLAEPAARGLALRRVFCSGEELPAALRDRFHQTLTGELHNLYGPTEAAVDVSFWPAGPDDRSVPVPIGFPVWNTRLLVLDAHGRPAPPGVAGHLHLGGVQLARGYLGRPDLTAERFRPDPFLPGERLYATGDLARVRAEDGAVVFLGRADHQVKIRGVRVELGEVEAALMATGRLRAAVVLARPDAGGTLRLVAYVVPAPGEAGTPADTGSAPGAGTLAGLREALARRLPEAMMPAAIVPLAALPVTANGKLDRAALPAPPQQGLESRPLAGAIESRIAALFAEQLRLGALPGPEDDFFALGGDSLDAVGLLLKLREGAGGDPGFGRDPGLGALFAHPTVAGLARLMEQEGLSDAGLDPLIRLVEGEPGLPPLFVIHPAGGIAWCYGGLARALAPRRTVYGLQAPALDPAVPVAESLEALAADYAGRIRAASAARPVHLAGWSVGGILAQAVAARLAAQGVAVGAVALLDAYPCDVWRAEPDPGEDGALKALLAIAGHDPDRLPALALTRPAVLAFLRATDSPLARLPAAALDGVVRVVAGNNRLVRGHHHRRYPGPLTHFRAALDHRERALDPQMWRPYAAGLEVHDIPALHAHLTGPAASARIAPLLSAALAARERATVADGQAALTHEQDLTSCA